MLTFIKREKIYILIVLFILAVNLMSIGQVKKDYPEEEKALSTMTFEEIGVTEEKLTDFFESKTLTASFFKYSIIFGFFIFIIGFISNLVFIFQRKRIDFKNIPYKRPVSWGISDLIRASIIIVFIGYIVGIIEGISFKLFNLNTGLNLRMIVNTFFIDLSAAVVILYFVMVKHKEKLQDLGLRFAHLFRNILSGLTAYISILPLLFLILLLSIWFLNFLGYKPPPQPVFEVFMEEDRAKVLLYLSIFVSVFGPIIEEMFFRGFMYSAIKKRLGVLGAAILTAAIFSFLHTNIVGFLPIMVLGVLLAYLYETTGSLIASMTVHILHNSIIVGFVFFVKKLIGPL